MLDKLASIVKRYEEVETLLSDPDVSANYSSVQALAKEHAGTVAKGAADTEQTDEDRVNAQQALVAEQAIQCGFCTPGIAIAAAALLDGNPSPSREDMDAAIPNICRCGVYPRLVRAITRAAESASGAAAIEAAPPPSVDPEDAARDVPALKPTGASRAE